MVLVSPVPGRVMYEVMAGGVTAGLWAAGTGGGHTCFSFLAQKPTSCPLAPLVPCASARRSPAPGASDTAAAPWLCGAQLCLVGLRAVLPAPALSARLLAALEITTGTC